MRRFHLHLVSDSTGETLESVAKAVLAQFADVSALKHFWPMVRSARQMDRVMDEIAARPGVVLYTLVDETIRDVLLTRAESAQLPTISVLDPVIQAMATYLGVEAAGVAGRQHRMDAAYFERIDAMHYTLAHDDGQLSNFLTEADIILVGVSRTSKTPTSIYLANRGYKTANVPLVPNCPIPDQLLAIRNEDTGPMVVGLTTSPDRLSEIRKNRLRSLAEDKSLDYADIDKVREEVQFARRLCAQRGWPVIDVTRRSIEETAAAVLNHYNQRVEPGPAQ
ncbi:MAG: pyruvate, water dikinase regulatory protein [Pseudomonadota bacterium]